MPPGWRVVTGLNGYRCRFRISRAKSLVVERAPAVLSSAEDSALEKLGMYSTSRTLEAALILLMAKAAVLHKPAGTIFTISYLQIGSIVE